MPVPYFIWALFVAGVVVLLLIDLFLHNDEKEVSPRQAAGMTTLTVGLSLLFGGWVWWHFGSARGLEFFTGYVIELSLSVDNIFVFVLLFGFFHVQPKYQHRVLFWGVMGAIVMRGIMIGVGALLVAEFKWILYFFGAFLVVTGLRMLKSGDNPHVDPEHNPVLILCRKILPFSRAYDGKNFMTVEDGKRKFTPLLLVLILVETTDLVFAVDSIPAIFAVTQDSFIVFTSNICAIVGLRSMYFFLAHWVTRLVYLKTGLALVLTFIGCKMLVVIFGWHIPITLSLAVVLAILTLSIVVSLLKSAPTPSD
jgi:tellurite resistance protein TerC